MYIQNCHDKKLHIAKAVHLFFFGLKIINCTFYLYFFIFVHADENDPAWILYQWKDLTIEILRLVIYIYCLSGKNFVVYRNDKLSLFLLALGNIQLIKYCIDPSLRLVKMFVLELAALAIDFAELLFVKLYVRHIHDQSISYYFARSADPIRFNIKIIREKLLQCFLINFVLSISFCLISWFLLVTNETQIFEQIHMRESQLIYQTFNNFRFFLAEVSLIVTSYVGLNYVNEDSLVIKWVVCIGSLFSETITGYHLFFSLSKEGLRLFFKV